MDYITGPFELAFVQRGVFEVLALSLAAGLLGTWIVLRGLAFYSHAVATAAFPGLVLADGLGFATPLGALGAALVFAVVLERLGRGRRTGSDSLTALVLAGALALGVILASDVFHSGSNVETLLFGSLFLIEPRDVAIAAGVSVLAAAATATLGRAWLVTGFDAAGARALGARSRVPELLLLVLIALTVIAAVSAVGALLVTALLVTPAATVRIWSSRLSTWRAGTVALTAVEGTAGLWLSVKTNAPPGATIAVLASAVFALAALARFAVSTIPLRAAAAGAAALVAALAVGACANSGEDRGTVDVLATTTQIGDWAREIGGADVSVHQILRANTDPHEYELRPADVQAAANADVVFENGDGLDGWAGKLVDDSGAHPEVVDLGSIVPIRAPGERGGSSEVDPHWWHDPRNAERAAEAIGAALAKRDPAERAGLRRRTRAYVARLRALDRAIAACIAKVPASERKLVTDHDAFGYFARRYAIEVVGAVIPSQTTEAQPSAGELAQLATLVEREHVRAIFPERSLSAKLAKALARHTGASATATLYGDALGADGSDGDTYLGMEAANARRIAGALTGGRVQCSIDAR
jgi:ABC-type Zn uptake system ZnuABC Zn-binding protein ZnuA/ABC-type Mn2+/Zn2+ transport system permease subunit